MRIIYDIDLSGGTARVNCTVHRGPGDPGGGPDISTTSDTGSGPDIATTSDTGSGPDISTTSDTGSGLLGCGCCPAVIVGPIVIAGCGHGTVETGTKIPKKRKVLTLADLGQNRGEAAPALDKFTMSCQEQSNWCWAAVGAAVHHHLPAAENLPQCEVVNRVSGAGSACADPAPLNVPASLSIVLTTLENLLEAHQNTVAEPEVITHETGSGRPIAVRIAWDPDRDYTEDGGHFVVIAGIRQSGGGNELLIVDPAGGRPLAHPTPAPEKWVPYEKFVDSYRLTGRWVATYLLRPTT